MEDIRQFTFGSLSENSKHQPSGKKCIITGTYIKRFYLSLSLSSSVEEQLKAVDELIDNYGVEV